jgi:uncharacterized delta-60 repeat protein
MKKTFTLIAAVLFSVNALNAAQWTVRKNGTGNGVDEIKAIVTDNAGNVYVTGNSYSSANGSDYVTIKYNTNGVQQWLARYNGPSNQSDNPHAIFVDNAGNVYVTGASQRIPNAIFDTDATTIKYNSQGVQQWVARYDDVHHREDAGNGIKVDANGNVYITGFTTVSNGAYSAADYLTIKYNASGIQQWVRTHNGPGNGGDAAVGLGLDGSGNIYVTGTDFAGHDPAGEGDYLTIKYNSAGTELWTARFNGAISEADGACAIAVDNAGNSYVTGSSRLGGINTDFITIKYNTNGVKLWQAQWGGAAAQGDIPSAIAVDNTGNVYVTGTDQKIPYNYDYRTIKYNSSGVLQWSKRYNGPVSDNDYGNALQVDGSGNVYVTGQSIGNSFTWDIATVKYNSSGVQQWVRRYNGTGNDFDAGYAVAIDGSGNVYVGGSSTGNNSDLDFITIKYNANGQRETGDELTANNTNVVLNNYPNPFTNQTTIEYFLKSDAKVILEIRDINGKAVLVSDLPGSHQGLNQYLLNLKDLKPGYYFLRLIKDGIVETRKIIKVNQD